jgi:hypothetical protein
MSEPFHERRRFPRHDLRRPAVLHVPVVHDVQLVEISRTGALFACAHPFAVGQRVEIRAVLARQPFVATIQIVRTARHALSATDGALCFAATILALDDASRRTLQNFLASAAPPAV